MNINVNEGRHYILLNKNDNVVTILDDFKELNKLSNGMLIQTYIPFGHKVSILNINKGEHIIKYGIIIGTATKNIKCGNHVHVHNCI